MENATKALLIAAAVLVAILIISLGLVVYNMASETIDSVNMSGQEITAFNDKFEQYEGSRVRGSEVNAMLRTVLNSNLQAMAESTDDTLTVGGGAVEVTGDVELEASATSLTDDNGEVVEADTSRLYSVAIGHNSSTGLVDTITVTLLDDAADDED